MFLFIKIVSKNLEVLRMNTSILSFRKEKLFKIRLFFFWLEFIILNYENSFFNNLEKLNFRFFGIVFVFKS